MQDNSLQSFHTLHSLSEREHILIRQHSEAIINFMTTCVFNLPRTVVANDKDGVVTTEVALAYTASDMCRLGPDELKQNIH